LHVLANVNTIKIFQKVYPHEGIRFISAAQHNAKVKTYFTENAGDISFEGFGNRRKLKSKLWIGLSLFKKGFSDLFFFRRILASAKPEDLLVVSHIYPHSLIFLKFLKKIYPNPNVVLLLHGEVEYMFFFKTHSQRLIGYIYRFCFGIKAKNFYNLFLTKASTDIIVNSGYLSESEVMAIELPTFVGSSQQVELGPPVQEAIRIGHIGSAGIRKNVDQLYLLANKIIDQISRGRVKLSAIGVLEHSIVPHLNALVENFVGNQIDQPLDRLSYDLEVSRLDYSIFFYSENDFLLRSSAAFFDAIYYEKPIIALYNKFFADTFQKNGKLGFLCKDLDEMKALIESLSSDLKHPARDYEKMVGNIKDYKRKLGLDYIAQDLKSQLSKRIVPLN